MPPVFGIFNTSLHRPDPEMISRMKAAAWYAVPRTIVENRMPGGYAAAAVRNDRIEEAEGKVFFKQEQYCVLGDVSLYGRTNEREREREWEREMGRRGEGERMVEAYLQWGEKCVKYLYGDFAFVIFNQRTGEVFCGRDPLGVRPLFYARVGENFIFASELRVLLAALPSRPFVRHEYLLDTLITVKTARALTPYENIYRLEPGHTLRINGETLRTAEYWSLDPGKAIRLDTEEEYIRLFREKLVHAVNSRCEGVVSPGAELSGGLDSSTVCGISAAFTGRQGGTLQAFSNIFPENTGIDFQDEQEFIGAMREFCSMEWTGVDRLTLPITELLTRAVEIQGCFIQQNFSIFNQGIYEAAGNKGVDVLLSGFGGDEMVSARTALPWNELIRDGEWRIILDELYYRGVSLRTLLKPIKLVLRYLVSRLHKPAYRTGVFTPRLLDRRFANLPLLPDFAASNRLRQRLGEKYRQPHGDRLAERQVARIMLDHLPQRMEYCYAAAAQHGLEYRYPLLDVDLVETCLAFPPWVKQHHGLNRYLFRQAIADFVPEKIRQRNDKSGTTIPQTHYSLANEQNEILDLIRSCSDSTVLQEIFDFSRFPEWYEKLVERNPEDMNYRMPGAFYDYLMMMMYFRDKGRGTRDEGQGTRDKGQGTRDEEQAVDEG
jgi:asparagine synthase (glutamine-hydrolysing)